MYEFKLPDLGEGVHEGELLKWYVKQGDVIAEDDPLVDVETDKAAVTIPSPRSGKVVTLNGDVGDTLHVGTVVVVIDDGAGGAEATAKEETAAPEAVPAPAPAAPEDSNGGPGVSAPAPASPAPAPTPVTAATAPALRRSGPIPAAPATRRLAREMGVELGLVQGTGPGGRVTMEDVKAFAAAGAPALADRSGGLIAAAEDRDEAAPFATPAEGGAPIPLLDLEPLPDFSEFGPVEKEPLRSIRRKVARKMVTSMVLVPHVAHMDEADVTELEAARKREKERLADAGRDVRLTMLAFVMKAVTVCLKQRPQFNASLDPFRGELIYKKFYNIGFAADTDRGLVVPVLKGVDTKNLIEISEGVAELARQAREGTIGVEDFRGGTFTVTNVGSLGGTGLIPTINYPEVAILGMGKMQDKPVVRDGQIVVRKMLPLTLAFDHRMADGADAARFMNDLVESLSDPMALLMRL